MSASVQTGKIQDPFVAHSPGNADIAFSSDMSLVITGSDDCMLRILNFEGNSISAEALGSKEIDTLGAITTIDCAREYLAVGNEDGKVSLWSLPEGESKNASLFTTTLPIRSVHFNSTGTKLAIATDDKKLVIVSVEDHTRIVSLVGHSKSVISCKFSPDDKYLRLSYDEVAAVCDGNVLIFDLSVKSPQIVATIPLYSPVEPEINDLSLSWSSLGNILAVPGESTISLVDTTTFKVSTELWGHKSATTRVEFSMNGKYLASYSASDKMMLIWDVENGNQINKCTELDGVTSFKWNNDKNMLLIIDNKGSINLWEEVIPPGHVPPTDMEWTKPKLKAKVSENLIKDEAKECSDEMDEDDGRPNVDDELSIASNDVDMYDDLDDFIADPRGDYDLQKYRSREAAKKSPETKLPPLEPYFQPSSTEFKGSKRFNMVGTIDVVKQEIHQSITINFHDKSSHRPINFKDHFGFNLGIVNERSAVFAAPSAKDSDGKWVNMSTLYYRVFDTWTANNEWTLFMDEGEDIIGLALAMKWTAAATSMHQIRIFSSSGIQIGIISLPAGPLVAMTGNDDYIFLAFYSSFLPGSRLEYQIFDVCQMSFCSSVFPLPLSPRSRLIWMGFADDNRMPLTYDSEGVLRMCQRHQNFTWTPILDTRPARKDKQEFYWPVGVVDQMMFYVLCKAGEKSPGFPTPILSDCSLAMPTVSAGSAVGKLEQQYLQTLYLYNSNMEAAKKEGDYDNRLSEFIGTEGEMDKIILRLIQKACQNERSLRALDLCTMLRREKSVEIAGQLALKHHLRALADRIEMVKHAKFSCSQKNSEEFEEPVQQQRVKSEDSPKLVVLEPIAPITREEESLADTFDAPATPAKRPSDHMFSSPCITITDEEKPKAVNPFKKKNIALTSTDLTLETAKRQKTLDISENKKRKTVQQKLSVFVKPMPKAEPLSNAEEKENDQFEKV